MKKILLIVATHGDEEIGSEIIEFLNTKGLSRYFDKIIANPKALLKKKRKIDFDLNRAYPGNKKSKKYERRRASEILAIAKKYEYIIDIHEASEGIDDFIIVPRKKVGDKFPLETIDLKRVLLWPEPKGPLASILCNAIELEFGMKNRNREDVVKNAVSVVSDFILAINLQKNIENYDKQFYNVYDVLKIDSINKNKFLKDFEKTKIDNESFYPLLVDQYLDEGIKCYKMKKM